MSCLTVNIFGWFHFCGRECLCLFYPRFVETHKMKFYFVIKWLYYGVPNSKAEEIRNATIVILMTCLQHFWPALQCSKFYWNDIVEENILLFKRILTFKTFNDNQQQPQLSTNGCRRWFIILVKGWKSWCRYYNILKNDFFHCPSNHPFQSIDLRILISRNNNKVPGAYWREWFRIITTVDSCQVRNFIYISRWGSYPAR